MVGMNEEVCESFATLSGSFTRQGSQARNLLRPLAANRNNGSFSGQCCYIRCEGRCQQDTYRTAERREAPTHTWCPPVAAPAGTSVILPRFVISVGDP